MDTPDLQEQEDYHSCSDLQEQENYHSCSDPVLEEILVNQLKTKGYFIRHESRSYVVDLNQVSMKLFDWATQVAKDAQIRREKVERDEPVPSSNCSTPTLVSRSGSFSPLSPEAQHQEYIRFEKQRYGKLVKDGGRPWYPIDLIDDLSRNPRDYHAVLRYWQGEFPDTNQDSWMMFGEQLEDWRNFRRWQAKMRKQNRASFPRYLKQTKARLLIYLNQQEHLLNLINLHKNPKKQDQLSTWLEYFSFQIKEYAEFSWYTSWENRYEDAWRKLVDTRLLRRLDSRNYLESPECAYHRKEELAQRRQTVETARSFLLVAERDLEDPAKKGPAADMQMVEARGVYDQGTTDWYASSFRNDAIEDFMTTTFHYRAARRRAVRHEILLGWIQYQIPFIQVEMAANMNPTMTNHVDPIVVDPALVTVEPSSPAPVLASAPALALAPAPAPAPVFAPALAKRTRPTERAQEQQPKRPRDTSQRPPIPTGGPVRSSRKTAATSPLARRGPRRSP